MLFSGEGTTDSELQPVNGRGRSPRVPADREPRKPPQPLPERPQEDEEWPRRPKPDEDKPWD